LRTHKIHATEDLDKLPEETRRAYHREFTARFHELLDAGHGRCHLERNDCAKLLGERLTAGQLSSYELDAWVVMPNHLHALVTPAKGVSLGRIIQSWKGGSAREINQIIGRTGQLWQREPFDHIVRSEPQLNHFRRYIALNPEKAGLRKGFVMGIGYRVGMTADAMLEAFGLMREPK
jgi:REP element-mobilizing transposase RayT